MPLPRQVEVVELDVVVDHEAGRQHLPPSLVSASISKRSSSTPRAHTMPPATSTTPASEKPAARPRQERQVAGHDVRRDEAAEQRQAAEVGDRFRVDVAVAHPGHRAGAQRDLAGEDREQVGDRRGDEEDREVLAHAAPQSSSVRVAPSGSSTSLRSLRLRRPRRSTRPWRSVTSTIVDGIGRRGVGPASSSTAPSSPASPRPRRRRWRPAARCGWPSSPPAGRCARAGPASRRGRASGPPRCRGCRPGPTAARAAGGRPGSAGPGQNSSIRARASRARRRPAPRAVVAADQHRRRHVPAAPLGLEQAASRPRG